MKYEISLTEEQEKFLDLYLKIYPLRPEHKREDYPGLIANNFINSQMKRIEELKAVYKYRYGEEWQ
jgi:hypothetical protein